MEVKTLEISVEPVGAPGSYRIVAQHPRFDRAEARMKVFPNRHLTSDLASLQRRPTTVEELEEIGRVLFGFLFQGSVYSHFLRALGEVQARDDLALRLVLRIEPPELAALPWELLYDPERCLFLATSPKTPISRAFSLNEPVGTLACPEEIRVLAIVPSTSGLAVEAERTELERLWTSVDRRAAVEVLTERVTLERIQQALRAHEVHLVHFIGHGTFEEEKSAIFLDGEDELPEALPAASFADLFTDRPSIRLIVLSSCEGAKRSSAEALAGLAPWLLRRGVPGVIAMQSVVSNKNATRFASLFYAELVGHGHSGDVEAALARTRSILRQERPWNPLFANPVLYLRAPDGLLWQSADPDPGKLLAAARATAERVRRGLEPHILSRVSRQELVDKYLDVIHNSAGQERSRILPILGAAGSGKSTLLGELYDRLLEGSLPWVLLLDGGELVGDMADLSREMGRISCGTDLPIEDLSSTFSRRYGPGVLLIDTVDLFLGPDAVPSLQRLFSALERSRTTVVFTCRDYDYQMLLEPPQARIPQVAHRIDRYIVPPFTDSEVAAAAGLFVEKSPVLHGSPAGAGFVTRLLTLSADSRSLAQITHNPLLLAMLCALFGEVGDVPRDLTVSELYDRYWEEKVSRSRPHGPGSPEAFVKPRICLRLAATLFERSRDRLRDAMVEEDLELEPTPVMAAARADLLSEGILKRSPPGWIRFFHQTFLEYAVARWLATAAGREAQQGLLAALRTGGEGIGLHWWPIVRQLLVRLDGDDFAAAITAFSRHHLAAFRTLCFATAARADEDLFRELLDVALVSGAEYQKTLFIAAEAAPARFSGSLWSIVEALLRHGEREVALFVAQAVAAILGRRGSPLGGDLRDVLRWIETRDPVRGDEILDLKGQLLAHCLDLFRARPEPEALRLLIEEHPRLGWRARLAILELFTEPVIPDELREEMARSLLARSPEKSLGIPLVRLLEKTLEGRFDRGGALSFEDLFRTEIPPAWESVYGCAAGRLLVRHEGLIAEVVQDIGHCASHWLAREVNAVHEIARCGGSRALAEALLRINPAEVLPDRFKQYGGSFSAVSPQVEEPLRRLLAERIRDLAPLSLEDFLIGLAALSDVSELSWQTFAASLARVLEDGRDDVARRSLRAVPETVLGRLTQEIEDLAKRNPRNRNAGMMLVQLHSAGIGRSDQAIPCLRELALGRFKDIALAASHSLARSAQTAEHLSVADLLPLAGSPIPGVRGHLVESVAALQARGIRMTAEELTRFCRSLERESSTAAIQSLCTIIGDWVRQERNAPRDVAEMVAGIPGRMGERFESGVARALIRALKSMAQLEMDSLADLLGDAARTILGRIDLNRVKDGESEMIDLLSALSRTSPGLLARVSENSSSLPPRNLRAVVAAVRRVEGKSSPILFRILEADWCPPSVRSLILDFQGV